MGDKSKFLGDTKGNRTNPPCMDIGCALGSGESHKAFGHNDKFLGSTKGNRDLPIDRSAGGGKPGKKAHIAGG